MDYSSQLALSYYKTIATLNEDHKVYLVQHQDTQEIFVKKILSVYNADIYKELATHPVCGTPRIIEYFEENNQLILIESYISGQSLERKMQTTHLNISDIIHYTTELCEILCQLHNLQPPIIHRDIKPSNIIITEYNHVVLLDFNAAKYYAENADKDTVLLGTKGYAAPEQYGFGSSSPRTDIYAVGILLKELTATLPEIPHPLIDVIEKCIEINPADRYETISELKAALEYQKTDDAEHLTNLSFRNYLLPGFRTLTPWKIFIATPAYLILFWLSLTLEVKDTYGAELWVQRIFCLFMFLSIIFGTCNYLDIQRFLPLCKSKHRIIKYIGTVVLDFMLVASFMVLMMLVLELFFGV